MSASGRSACLSTVGTSTNATGPARAVRRKKSKSSPETGERLVIAADLLEARAGDDRCRREHDVAHDHPVVDVAPVQRAGVPRRTPTSPPAAIRWANSSSKPARKVKMCAATSRGPPRRRASSALISVQIMPGLGDALEARELERELAGAPHVVGVQKGHELPAGPGQAGVTRARHAGLLLEDVDHARVAAVARRDDLPGLVGGPVVDDDRLELGPLLGQHAVDGAGDHRRAIVSGDDHADHGPSTVEDDR